MLDFDDQTELSGFHVLKLNGTTAFFDKSTYSPNNYSDLLHSDLDRNYFEKVLSRYTATHI